MTDDLEDLKGRLVMGHKRDGRCVYNEAAKSELVALCLLPGASVSRLAREFGVNANQVGRWLREHGHGGRARKSVAGVVPAPAAFVAVSLPAASPMGPRGGDSRHRSAVHEHGPVLIVSEQHADHPHLRTVTSGMTRSTRCAAPSGARQG